MERRIWGGSADRPGYFRHQMDGAGLTLHFRRAVVNQLMAVGRFRPVRESMLLPAHSVGIFIAARASTGRRCLWRREYWDVLLPTHFCGHSSEVTDAR